MKGVYRVEVRYRDAGSLNWRKTIAHVASWTREAVELAYPGEAFVITEIPTITPPKTPQKPEDYRA